jgi:hypothetical protein
MPNPNGLAETIEEAEARIEAAEEAHATDIRSWAVPGYSGRAVLIEHLEDHGAGFLRLTSYSDEALLAEHEAIHADPYYLNAVEVQLAVERYAERTGGSL